MKTRQGVLPDTLLKHGFLKFSEVADKSPWRKNHAINVKKGHLEN